MNETARKGAVLFAGHSYYHNWYLSRELRKLGWIADTLNIDNNPRNQMYYHGEDYKLDYGREGYNLEKEIRFFKEAIDKYDIFHFCGAGGLQFMRNTKAVFGEHYPDRWEVRLLKNQFNKKIVYANNSCHDGVLKSSFSEWGPFSVCADCAWRDVPSACSDEKMEAWGTVRNELADYQIMYDGNRKDFNLAPNIHLVPQYYCLDKNFWHPDLLVPANYLLPYSKDTVKIYHAVGNFDSRTAVDHRNVKSTHIYFPTVESLKSEGYNVELVFVKDVPNKEVRYYQVQADIVVDMLTFGFFGANVREALMLGKPVVCYLRPEWLETMRAELPDYVDEMPVVSATPETVYDVLKDLVTNPDKRKEIGVRSRKFAEKWHSSEAGAKRLDEIYSSLLNG